MQGKILDAEILKLQKKLQKKYEQDSGLVPAITVFIDGFHPN